MAFTLIEEANTPDALAATSKDITFSAAPSDGELIVICFSVNNSGADYQVSIPGFTAAAPQSDDAFRTLGVLYKVAGPSESATYTMSMTGSAVLTGIGRRFSGSLGTINANTILHEASDVASISDSLTAAVDSLVVAYAYTSSTATKSWNAGWQPQQSPYRTTGVYKLSAGATETATMTLDSGTNNRLSLALVEFTASASGPNISSSPTTAFPGQSRTLTGTGFGATQGTGGVTIGGVAQTITSWSDTEIIFTTVLGTNSYGVDKTLEVTTDSAASDTALIDLVADTAGGFGVVTMSSPNTTDDSSVAFNATPAVATGDQFEWEDFNALGNLVIDAQGFVESVDTPGTFRGRFWDATDSTWGAVEDFTLSDTIAPVIQSIDVPAAGTYIGGQDLVFTANFNENVDITGNPVLNLDFDGTPVQASYTSGTGTSAIVFTRTVQPGDEDSDGIGITSLTLEGGTIQDASGNNANLTLNGVGDTSGVLVDSGPDDQVVFGTPSIGSSTASAPFSYSGTDVTGFEYSLDGGAWTATTSPVELSGLTESTEYTLEVRPVNDSGPGVPTPLVFTTESSVDATPDPFTLTDQADVALSNEVISNAITVLGVDAGVDIPVTITGDASSEYSVSTNGGSTWGGWTSASTNVRLNYQIRVRHTSSNEYSSGGYDGVRASTLDVGGVSDTFQSTTVADTTAPVISLVGGNQTVEQNDTWVEPGYTATDNADGDITAGVVVTGTVDTSTLGEYTLTYTSTDLSGNQTQVTRTVTVVEVGAGDNTAPVISLSGGNQTLSVGDTWVEPGYTATDDVDGDLTGQVVVTGTVDTSVADTYTLTYTVSDAAGNEANATRTVTVFPAELYSLTILAPAQRTYEATRAHRPELSSRTFAMRAGEELDFDFDLTKWLADQGNDSLSPDSEVITEDATVLEVLNSGQVPDTGRVKVWLGATAASPGESYPVQLKVSTLGSRTAVFQFRMIVI